MLPQLKRLLPFLILLMAPALHAQCGPSTPAFTASGSAVIRLNDASGTAPVWITNQNVASAVDAVAFQ